MSDTESIGERVRLMRLALGLSQKDLAKAVTGRDEPGNSVVSKVEAGRQRPDADLLDGLASALDCSSDYLLRGANDVLATRPWLRAYADAPAKTVESISAENVIANEVFDALGLKRLPVVVPIFGADPNDPDAIERFAAEVRDAAQMSPDEVVGNMMRTADRLGCVVLPLKSELGRHLGMSQRIDGTPFIRVSRPRVGSGAVPGDRQRFTVAHELGHHVLHSGQAPPDSAEDARRIERQAHRFASAFLVPANAVIEDWERGGGRVTLSALADLKAIWGVSIKSLVVRFQQLGVIGPDQATSLYKQISKRGWNTGEPVPVTHERPIWLEKAMRHRFQFDDTLLIAELASRLTGVSPRLVEQWTDWSTVEERLADVVAFPEGVRSLGG